MKYLEYFRRVLMWNAMMAVVIGGLTPSSSGSGIVSTSDEANLRAAMVGGGTVEFACSGTITLSNPLIITNNTIFNGAGYTVEISGGDICRLFIVQSSNTTLDLRNLTLRNGLARGTNGATGVPGGPGLGGAVFVDSATLYASNCLFRCNVALGGTGGGAMDPFFGSPAPGGDGRGGAVYSRVGTVFIQDCRFENNEAHGANGAPTTTMQISAAGNSSGGAVCCLDGQLQVTESYFTTNRSIPGIGQRRTTPYAPSGFGSGGAIEISSTAASLQDSIFRANETRVDYVTSAAGGAVTLLGGSLVISNSSFTENRVEGGLGLGISTPQGLPGGNASGGGLYVGSGNASILNTCFGSNLAVGGQQTSGNTPGAARGGAIFNLGNMSITNCTLAQNQALAGENYNTGVQGGAFGGAFYNGGTATVAYATVALNKVVPSLTNQYSTSEIASGAGVFSTNGNLTFGASILCQNTMGSNFYGPVIDLGHNLSSDFSGNLNAMGSQQGIDPKLGPLDDYGGIGFSMPLLIGSPAINAGDLGNYPSTDQRGRPRPFGTAPDIGAFESSAPYVIRGIISGATLNEEVNVGAGGTNVINTKNGRYALFNLAVGTHLITPSSSNYLFIPTNRSISVGPDCIDVNFKAYRWNALSLEDISNQTVHLVYAGTNGQSVRLLSSTNLLNWAPVQTNVIGSSNYLEMFSPIEQEPSRFYRSSIP